MPSGLPYVPRGHIDWADTDSEDELYFNLRSIGKRSGTASSDSTSAPAVRLEPPLMPASSSEPAVPSVSVDPQEDEISLHDVDPVTGPFDAANSITTR